ncbi:MAG: saccharopine dehydrogenase NADP-binding domain-containing protein [Armatimonadetes bacterium]|nr:saccharopine dehydrogenase NADP-binding domain-containing protein [Armatimonadota bacterium]
MSPKTILILGGYGGTGLPIARLLLQETEVRLILAGRHTERADTAAAQLNSLFPGLRVLGCYADATAPNGLRAAFRDADMVLVCSSTADYVREVAQAALAAGIDYLDIHYAQKKVPVLQSLAPAIREAGRCFITEAGFHPGLPSALVRHAASHFTHLRQADVDMVMSGRLQMTDSVQELIKDLGSSESRLFTEGRWRKATYQDTRKIDFGPNFGTRLCYPIQLEEMRALPEQYALERTGIYVAGFNWFVDYLVFPLAIVLAKIREGFAAGPLARLMVWGINTFSRPPFGVVVTLAASGEKDDQPHSLRMAIQHSDAYEFTAVCAVACVLQYLDGTLAKPGLWMMGHVVDPGRLIEDLARMGARIETRTVDCA